MPSHPAGNRLRDRARRIAVAALLVASAIGLGHVTARPVAATDCVTYYCATIRLTFVGDGSGHVIDNQGGIDCYYNGSTLYGTCLYQYYWIGNDVPDLYVLVRQIPNANSYACQDGSCGNPGDEVQKTVRLQRNDFTDVYAEFHLANAYSVHIATSGDGSGTTTSNPTGINCHVANGVASGTCDKTWYFRTSLGIDFSANPSPANLACLPIVGSEGCGQVDQTRTWTVIAYSTLSATFEVRFKKGHPIVTVAVIGSGTVTSLPAGISCPSTCSSYFAAGSLVSLSAASKTGYLFAGWSGACAGSVTICNLTLDTADKSATATFVKIATPPPTAPPSTPRPTATSRPGATATPRPSAGTMATATPLGQSPAPSTSSQAASSPGAGSAAPSGEPEASELTPTGTTATAPSGSSNPLTAAGASPGPSAIDVTSAPGSQPPGMDPLAIIVAVVVGVALGVAGLGLLLLGRSRRRAPTPRS